MNYFEKAMDLYSMIQKGKMLEAKDKYYHENVKVIDASGNIREGKEKNKKYDKEFINEIQEIFGGDILAMTSNEERQITMVEYWIELKFKNGLKRKYEEIAVQHWQDEKIILERFYKSK